jgi:hypothetical protein
VSHRPVLRAALGSLSERMVRLMRKRVRLGIVGAAGSLVVALVVLAVGLLTGGHDGVSAKPLPRGGLVAVPEAPAVLNRPAVLKTLNGVRAAIKVPALARSGCLDAAAATLAESFDTDAIPTSAPSMCGRMDWGWVAGSDRSGAQQANAAYGRTPAGPSPLISKTVKHLGLAVGPRRQSGVLTGYVLVWVVSA